MLPNWEEFLLKYKFQISILLIGGILVGLGVFIVNKGSSSQKTKIEVLEVDTDDENASSNIIVEIAGAVEKPGVYRLEKNSRIEDLLILAGGVSADADRDWMEKTLNRAAKLTDGQKIYIAKVSESLSTSSTDVGGYQTVSGSRGSGLINVNTASQKELESLWGIGPVYAQNIIEQRPYSSVEELLNKGVIKSNVYERNKDKITVY